MKLETLRSFFRRSRSTKLFVATAELALAGHAARPREIGGALLVDIGPVVVWRFAEARLEESERPYPLALSAEMRVTRRLRTHERHLAGRDVPDAYLRRAAEL